ncbi:MAG: hypothetical protein C0424_02510 [Sphingobacteriaceae bacterium]|nr:hypothetical protein [Sphingobacteriaceae bacterium]
MKNLKNVISAVATNQLHNCTTIQNMVKPPATSPVKTKFAWAPPVRYMFWPLILLALSCNTPSEKVENAQEKVDIATSDLDEANKMYEIEVDSFKADVNRQIADNEKEIQRLKSDRNLISSSQSKSYEADLTELQLKLEKLKVKLNNYEANQRDGWESFKAELKSDMTNLGNALKDFTKK